jgi:hypothetical protein
MRKAPMVAVLVAALTVTLAPIAAAAPGPTAIDDTVTMTAGDPAITIDVLANDTFDQSATLSITEPDAPQHGNAIVVDEDPPSIVYTPDPTYYGQDQFTYTLTTPSGTSTAAVIVTVPALPPTANPDTATTLAGTPVTVTVTANDTDPYGSALTVTSVAQPGNGTALITGPGTVTYTPATGWTGTNTFAYTITAAGTGLTATGTVTVTTNPKPVTRSVTLTAQTSTPVHVATPVTATVNPLNPGPVTVALQQRTGTTWVTLTRGTAGRDARVTFRYTPTGVGTTALRAVATWADRTQAIAPIILVKALPVAAPLVSGPLTRSDVPYSYRAGCPVKPSSLRRLTINHWDYQGRIKRGTLIVAASAVPALRAAFTTAFNTKFRIKSMIPVDAFYRAGTRTSPQQSDINAMNAGNTSVFNCRHVTGNRTRMSQHSYGNAIDINTFQNPYVTRSRVYPAAAARRYHYERHLHLSDPGVLTRRSSITVSLLRSGWQWGARWSNPDYQHFSATGG